ILESATEPRIAERPALPDMSALAGKYRLPDPPVQLSIVQDDASLVAITNEDTLTLDHLEGSTFIGLDPGIGYMFVEFEPDQKTWFGPDKFRKGACSATSPT